MFCFFRHHGEDQCITKLRVTHWTCSNQKTGITHSSTFVTVICEFVLNIYGYNVLSRYSLFQIAQSITPNIIMFLPRNVDLSQLEELAWLSSPPLNLEVKHCLEERHY